MFLIDASLKKVDGLDRVVSAAETLSKMTSIATALGVTRLADITGLDRIGIPVYSSVVPDSPDLLSVYAGKGARSIDAKVGAIMEAIERQTAIRTRLSFTEASFISLRQTSPTLDPRSVNQRLRDDYSEATTFSWSEAVNLVTQEKCWVPSKHAGFLWRELPHPSPFATNDTTGLASGNTFEEAVCHALCELAERDAWTMAELGARQLPRERRSLAFGVDHKDGPDDFELYPCLDLPGDDPLLRRFEDAGLFPMVRDITSSLGVPTFFASVVDQSIEGSPMAHSGLGTHPDARVALRRSLTEVAQSRCVDIQATREDILPPDAKRSSFALHTRRLTEINRNSWCITPSVRRRALEEVPSHCFDSVKEDLDFLIERFAANGLDQILVVDFTPRAENYSVVRVIVPGIELWATDRGKLGPRAHAYWRAHV